jgi:hypothetical protein
MKIIVSILILVNTLFASTQLFGFTFGSIYTGNCVYDSIPNEFTNGFDYFYEFHRDVETYLHGDAQIKVYISPTSNRIYKIAVVEWISNAGDRAQKYEYLKYGIQSKYGRVSETTGDFNTAFVKVEVLYIKTSYSKSYSNYVVTEYTNSVGYNRMLNESRAL